MCLDISGSSGSGFSWIGKEDPTADRLVTTPSSGFARTPPSPISVPPIASLLWLVAQPHFLEASPLSSFVLSAILL